ncbi:MAG: response regulator [Ignavibacterium sp.]|nr:response regulator [Ignavibacterium sp.]
MNRILIIDDNQENINYLTNKLTNENFLLISISGVEEYSHKIEIEKPDLILLNLRLKNGNGLEIYRKFSITPAATEIPVLLITSEINDDEIKDIFESGAFGYLKMPVSKVELISRITSALNFRETHKLILEAEKINTFTATVVTANHKIKQPLTLIKLSLTALKRELAKDTISKEAALKRIEYIDNAVTEISNILNSLNAIEKPKISDYVRDIKMIDLDEQKSD